MSYFVRDNLCSSSGGKGLIEMRSAYEAYAVRPVCSREVLSVAGKI